MRKKGLLYQSQTVVDQVVCVLKDTGIKLQERHVLEALEANSNVMDSCAYLYVLCEGKCYRVHDQTHVPKEIYDELFEERQKGVPVTFVPHQGKKFKWARAIEIA